MCELGKEEERGKGKLITKGVVSEITNVTGLNSRLPHFPLSVRGTS